MAGDATRVEQGAARLREVHAGDVVDLPEGTMAFNDAMVRTLLVGAWARDVLDLRSRRLLLLGVIASDGPLDTWKTQTRASLRNGELTPDERRETLIMLAPYAGHPNASGLLVACEEAISQWERVGKPGPAEPVS